MEDLFHGIGSFFIIIFGFIMLIVGIFPAIIWISSSFAALYESVLQRERKACGANCSVKISDNESSYKESYLIYLLNSIQVIRSLNGLY